MKIGVLAFQGDVIEHINALKGAIEKLSNKTDKNKKEFEIIEVRSKKDLEDVIALILPGGESTTIQKLCERGKHV